MSHAATNWAFQQRGLKPATRIVLLVLADCHNPSQGCFPSQAHLAEVCEMSRASINNHLNVLEEMGLIRREAEVDERTRRQRPTRYFLSFEGASEARSAPETVSRIRTRPVSKIQTRAVSKKAGKPCPNSGESRVQNLDTNPVKGTVINPRPQSASPAASAQDIEVADRKEASKRERIASWINGGPAICGDWVTPARLQAMVEAGTVSPAQARGALAFLGVEDAGAGGPGDDPGDGDAGTRRQSKGQDG